MLTYSYVARCIIAVAAVATCRCENHPMSSVYDASQGARMTRNYSEHFNGRVSDDPVAIDVCTVICCTKSCLAADCGIAYMFQESFFVCPELSKPDSERHWFKLSWQATGQFRVVNRLEILIA